MKNNVFLENTFEKIFDIINSSSILVVKCYKYIFKRFTKSIGGIIASIAIALHLIYTAFYFIFGKKQIINYVYGIYEKFSSYINKEENIIPSFPPKKKTRDETLRNKLFKNKKEVHFNEAPKTKGKRKVKYLRTEKDKSRNEKSTVIIYDSKNFYQNKSEKEDLSKKRIISESQIKFSKKYRRRKKTDNYSINSISEIKQIKDGEYKQFFDEYFVTSLDEVEYDEAINKDQRTFCQYFRECLKKKQMIAFTFIASDPIKIRIIKIMLFNLNIVLYFLLIGFFYGEEYIGELYDINKEDERFFDYIPRNIGKFIYTIIASITISYLTSCFFEEERKLKRIFKREKENVLNLRNEIKGFIKDTNNRYLFFIFFILVMLIISLYYLLCFNYVYRKSQLDWIKASLTIFVIMQILSILKCFLETCLRYMSFCIKSEKLFKIYKIFN